MGLHLCLNVQTCTGKETGGRLVLSGGRIQTSSAAECNAVASVWDACAHQWRFEGSWVKTVTRDQSVSLMTLIYKVWCPDSDVGTPSVRDRWFSVTHAINAALTADWSAFREKDAHALFIRVRARATPLGYFSSSSCYTVPKKSFGEKRGFKLQLHQSLHVPKRSKAFLCRKNWKWIQLHILLHYNTLYQIYES